jgi:hypothetical protein
MYKSNETVGTLFANAYSNDHNLSKIEYKSKLAEFQACIVKLKLASPKQQANAYQGVYSFNSKTNSWESIEVANAGKAAQARAFELKFFQYDVEESEDVDLSPKPSQKAAQGQAVLNVANNQDQDSLALNQKLHSALQQLAQAFNMTPKTPGDASLAMEVMDVIMCELNQRSGNSALGNPAQTLSKNNLCLKLRYLGRQLESKGSDHYWLKVLGLILVIAGILVGGSIAAILLVPSYVPLVASLLCFSSTEAFLGVSASFSSLAFFIGTLGILFAYIEEADFPPRGDASVAKAVADICEASDLEPNTASLYSTISV